MVKTNPNFPAPPNPWRIAENKPIAHHEEGKAMLEAIPEAAQTATPLHEHGAFDDAGASLAFIDRAKDAMLCIGDMLQPNMTAADEDLHGVKRSQVAALFAFFGEALSQPVEEASEANQRLWLEAKKRGDCLG